MAKKTRQWALEERETRDVPDITDAELEISLVPWESRGGADVAALERRSWNNRWRGLQDAVACTDEGHPVLLIEPGCSVLIERYSGELGGSYLDMRLYTVVEYDPVQGDVRLWDNEGQQWAGTNILAGTLRGLARYWMPQLESRD